MKVKSQSKNNSYNSMTKMRIGADPTVLAIDPGTKEMGVAVFHGESLEYFGVKTINRKKTSVDRLNLAMKIVIDMIRLHRPQVLVMEKSFFYKTKRSSVLNVLTSEIRKYAFNKGMRLSGYAPTAVKKLISGSGKANKAEVARNVVKYYPELKRYLHFREDWRIKYWQNMFDAVALGIMFQMREKSIYSANLH